MNKYGIITCCKKTLQNSLPHLQWTQNLINKILQWTLNSLKYGLSTRCLAYHCEHMHWITTGNKADLKIRQTKSQKASKCCYEQILPWDTAMNKDSFGILQWTKMAMNTAMDKDSFGILQWTNMAMTYCNGQRWHQSTALCSTNMAKSYCNEQIWH